MRARRLALLLPAFALAAPVPRAIDPSTPAIASAEGLPAGALGVVTGDDLRSFWTRFAGTRLVQELAAIPDVRQAWDEAQIEAGLPVGEALLTLVGERFAAGFYGSLDADRPELVLVADVADPAAARRVLEAMERGAAADTIAFGDQTHDGVSIRVGTRANGAVVAAWALEGERLTLASGLDRLRGALDLVAGRGESMAAVPEYVDAIGRVDDAPLRFWLDPAALEGLQRATADTLAPGETTGGVGLPGPAGALLAPVALFGPQDAMRAVAGSIRWGEAGLEGEAVGLLRPDAPEELRRILVAPPETVETWRYLPSGTLFHVASTGLDPAEVVAALRADSLVAARWESWERAAGLDFEDELVPALGSQAGLAVVGVAEGAFFLFPAPEILITVAVADSSRAHAVMTRLEETLAEAARTRGSMTLAWQSAEHAGRTIRSAPTPIGDALAPSWSLMEGFALIGSRQAAVARAIDTGAGGPTLTDDPTFAPLRDFYPARASVVAYFDVEAMLGEVRKLMGTLGMMRAEGDGPSNETIDQVLAALQNASRAAAWSAPDGDAIRWRSLLLVR